jgi:hypothetical protein
LWLGHQVGELRRAQHAAAGPPAEERHPRAVALLPDAPLVPAQQKTTTSILGNSLTLSCYCAQDIDTTENNNLNSRKQSDTVYTDVVQDIGSGNCAVHNTLLLDHPQKSIILVPWRFYPTHLWSPHNRKQQPQF